MKIFFVALFTLILLSFQSTLVSACSCVEGSLTDSINSTNYIFIGTVEESTKKSNDNLLTIKIEKVFKGDIKTGRTEVFGTDISYSNSAACSSGFEVGKKYLMSSDDSKNGVLIMNSSTCDTLSFEIDSKYEPYYAGKIKDIETITGIKQNQNIFNIMYIAVGIVFGISITYLYTKRPTKK